MEEDLLKVCISTPYPGIGSVTKESQQVEKKRDRRKGR